MFIENCESWKDVRHQLVKCVNSMSSEALFGGLGMGLGGGGGGEGWGGEGRGGTGRGGEGREGEGRWACE